MLTIGKRGFAVAVKSQFPEDSGRMLSGTINSLYQIPGKIPLPLQTTETLRYHPHCPLVRNGIINAIRIRWKVPGYSARSIYFTRSAKVCCNRAFEYIRTTSLLYMICPCSFVLISG